MNDLEILNKEIQECNNKRIRLQTIIDQSEAICKELEQKYGIKNESEFCTKVEEAKANYEQQIQKASLYIADCKQALQPFEGIL